MKVSRSRYRSYKFIGATILLCAAVLLGGCGAVQFPEQAGEELAIQEDCRLRKVYLEDLDDIRKPLVPGRIVRELSLEDISGVSGDGFLYADVSRYAYEKMSESEKIWYRDMEYALGAMEDKVKLSEQGIKAGLDESNVDKIFQYVLCDHPELFYVEGYTYTQYSRGDKTVAIDFSGSYSINRKTVEERKKEIEAEVALLLEEAPKFGGDYEKVKYVYETLIENTDYDIESEDNQNIYSVFVNHRSVCQGYAKAAQYLLNRMGIFSTLVQGKVRETGEGHAWNLVQLDGDYYYLDTTWGDISYQAVENRMDQELPQISYDYFCITTEQLLKTHSIESLVSMPVCTAEADNYYVHENALFSEYDSEKLDALVAAAKRRGRRDITLRCDSEECYRKMCDILLEQQEIFHFLSETGSGTFAYTQNDAQWTLTFFMMTNE